MLKEKLEEYLAPVVRFENYELIDLQLLPQRKKLVLKVLINKSGGITLGECVEMNKKISKILDKAELINESYILEVSSPGINRHLKDEKDFKCIIGRELNVKTKKGEEYQGSLLEVFPEGIFLAQKDKVVKILFSEIERAKQIIKFNSDEK